MRRFLLSCSLSSLLGAAACTSAPEELDNFAGGSHALALSVAPAGLCDGNGSDKECAETASCESRAPEPSSSTSAPASSNSQSSFGGAGGFSGGAAAPPPTTTAPPSQPAYAPLEGAEAPDDGRDDGEEEEDLCEQWRNADAGAPPPECESDAGVELGSSAQAITEPGVPTCGSLDSERAATLFMSADDSASVASPVIARRMIRGGQRIPARVLRTYEFLNYYDFSFEPAEAGEVRIVPQLSSCPVDGQLSLQVALQAEARDPEDRAAINLTLVLDTSGSMEGEPIHLEREAVRAMFSQLREGDVVSMVTWNTTQNEILTGHHVSGADDPALVAALDMLQASGGTDLHAGLTRGYELAQQHRANARINRVVIISDGQANVGITDVDMIAAAANDEDDEEGIYLSGIGVGDGVNDRLMDTVTDAGRGAYVYLDSAEEAQRMLGERFLQVVDVAARSVRLEVTLPWYMVIEKFFGEVVSTDATEVQPQHLGPNDAMVFFQVLNACDPSQLHGDDRIRLRATWQRPFSREKKEAEVHATLNQLAGDDRTLEKAAAIAGYAEALALADSLPDDGSAWDALDDALQDVLGATGADSDPDLLEVAELLERYRDTFWQPPQMGARPTAN